MYRLMCPETAITHGQRFLLNLLDKRQFASFCRENNLKFEYIFNVAVGKKIPPVPVIYALRHIIHPNSWFYLESENLPLPEYTSDTGETWNYQTSKGFSALQNIVEDCGAREWAIQHSMDYTTLWLILTGRRTPSFPKIKFFRPYIEPSDWFYRK